MPVIGKNSQAQKIFKGFKRLGWLRGAPAMFSTYCPSYSMNSCFLYTLLDAQLSLPLVIKTFCLTLYHKLMGHAFFFDLPLCFFLWFFFTLFFFLILMWPLQFWFMMARWAFLDMLRVKCFYFEILL
jgi:hypothetical protein